jgi:hypothetical protein
LLDKAGVEPDEDVIFARFVEATKRCYWDRETKVRSLT